MNLDSGAVNFVDVYCCFNAAAVVVFYPACLCDGISMRKD